MKLNLSGDLAIFILEKIKEVLENDNSIKTCLKKKSSPHLKLEESTFWGILVIYAATEEKVHSCLCFVIKKP